MVLNLDSERAVWREGVEVELVVVFEVEELKGKMSCFVLYCKVRRLRSLTRDCKPPVAGTRLTAFRK